MKEIECPYYNANAMPGMELEDQEARRDREEEEFGGLDSFEDVAESQLGSLVMLSVDRLRPHPDNPRKELGDLTELAESIKANGIFQNLTVVPDDPTSSYTTFTVIIGHRRLAAAKLAGLTSVPCVITEMTEKEQLQTMLMENMQRSDLTVYEQAQGFQMMFDMGSTVEEIAEKSGFSKSTVRRRLEIAKLDSATLKKVSARQLSLSDFDELAKVDDMETRNKILKSIGTVNFQNELKSALSDQKCQKRIEEWLATIRIFAEECPEANYSSHQYWQSYDKWNLDKEVVVPEDAETTKYVYKIDTRSITVYKEKDKEKEQREQAERDERNRVSQLHRNELDDVNGRHYELRSEFVKGISNAEFKKHFGKAAAFCADVMWDMSEGGYNSAEIDLETFGYLAGMKIEETDEQEDRISNVTAIQSAMEAFPEKALFVLAYSACDSPNEGYWRSNWANGKYDYIFNPNKTLDFIYEVLAEFGYELSDEERQAKTGKHPLFKKEENEQPAEPQNPCEICKASHPTCDKCCNACENHCNAWQVCQNAGEDANSGE